MEPRERSTVRVLYVTSRDDDSIAGALRDAWESSSVVVAETVAAAAERLDDAVDCVVTDYDLADGTGTEVLDAVDESSCGAPVVVLVEVTDGSNVRDAVRSDPAECVPIATDDPSERVVDAVSRYVPSPEGPAIADPYPPAGQSVTEWKANIFDQLFSKIPIYLYVKDHDCRHILVNEAQVSDLDNVLGKRDTEIGFVPPEEAREAMGDDRRVFETGEPILDKREHYPSRDIWNRTSKVPWYDTDGEIAGLIGLTQDITEQKRREQQLKVINHLLRHNLRNEMNVIRGHAEAIRNGTGDGGDRLEEIVRTIDELLATVDKQQDIVRTLTENRTLEQIDAADVVAQVVDAMSDRYPDARISCSLPESATVEAIDGLGRAIEELIENAIIHSDRDRPSVEVRLERGDERVRIRIADDGPTIPEMEVAVLTGTRELEPLFHGSGLGLWLVNWIISQSEGDLSFESNEPRGNLVTVTVPLAE